MMIRIVKKNKSAETRRESQNELKTLGTTELREDWLKESRFSLQMERANDLAFFGYSEKLHAVYSANGYLKNK